MNIDSSANPSAPSTNEPGSLPLSRWPVSERPRERLMKNGAGALSDAELLAVCLGSGDGSRDAIAFARGLLTEFGGLRPLLQATLPGSRRSAASVPPRSRC